MTEDERKRMAIVWDLIEQSAFRPEKADSWLAHYSRQLRRLLEVEPVWSRHDSRGLFQIQELGIACRCKIEGPDAYVACLKRTEDKRTLWSVHADATNVSKAGLHMAGIEYPDAHNDAHLRCDVESVLDGMLFHPRNHAHLSDVGFTTAGDTDPSCGMLEAADIRVTSSAYNGFVFLYHLAYQLCVVSKQARRDEKRRLIDLFEDRIRRKKLRVNAPELFDFRSRSS